MLNIKSLEKNDKETTNALSKVFKSKVYANLQLDLKHSLYQHKAIWLVGNGKLGRLAMQVEANWKKFWLNLINIIPDRKDEFLANCKVLNSISIGGDLTLINTTIDFKDLYMISNRQIEATINDGDICIIYGDDGTSRAINQAAITASKMGASVYYLYNMPKEAMNMAIDIMNNKRIAKIGLGSEALSVSSLKEMIFSYASLEQVSNAWLEENLIDQEYKVTSDKGYVATCLNDYVKSINIISKSLVKDKNIKSLERLNILLNEENVAFVNHNYIFDIISALVNNDVVPLKKRLEKADVSPKHLAFDALYPTSVAWQHVFRRSIRGLDEAKNTYKMLGMNNPKITSYHSSELNEHLIGYEYDLERFKYNLVFVDVNEEYENDELDYFNENNALYKDSLILRIGRLSRSKLGSSELSISVKLPKTCLDFYTHLLICLLFNK